MIDAREHHWGLELTGFGRPFGLGRDAAGRLHVTDMDRHTIVRFAADFSAHEILSAPGVWNGPHAIDFAPDGRAFVTCYYTPGIYVIGDDRPLAFDVPLTGPASALFDGAGRLLVSEYSQNAVFALATDGRLAVTFQGRFDRPHMARALADGSVVVADTWHNRLQRFQADGRLLDEAVAAVPCPVAIDVDAERGWLVTAWGDNAVVRFDAAGRPRGRLLLGGLKPAPTTAALHKPYDARWLPGDRVAVADSHHARVVILQSPIFH